MESGQHRTFDGTDTSNLSPAQLTSGKASRMSGSGRRRSSRTRATSDASSAASRQPSPRLGLQNLPRRQRMARRPRRISQIKGSVRDTGRHKGYNARERAPPKDGAGFDDVDAFFDTPRAKAAERRALRTPATTASGSDRDSISSIASGASGASSRRTPASRRRVSWAESVNAASEDDGLDQSMLDDQDEEEEEDIADIDTPSPRLPDTFASPSPESSAPPSSIGRSPSSAGSMASNLDDEDSARRSSASAAADAGAAADMGDDDFENEADSDYEMEFGGAASDGGSSGAETMFEEDMDVYGAAKGRRTSTRYRYKQAASAFPDTSRAGYGARRSRRIRMKPLAFWKNERMVMGRSDNRGVNACLPAEFLGVQRDGAKTPARRKRRRKLTGAAAQAVARKKAREQREAALARRHIREDTAPSSDEEDQLGAPVPIPQDLVETDPSYTLEVDNGDEIVVPLFKSTQELQFEELPPAEGAEDQAGQARAAAAFVEGNIKAGVVELDPGSHKDVEFTSGCSIVFHVHKCTSRALQMTISGQSKLARSGDMFMIPPNSEYFIINHSRKTKAVLSYTIIESDAGAGIDEPDSELVQRDDRGSGMGLEGDASGAEPDELSDMRADVPSSPAVRAPSPQAPIILDSDDDDENDLFDDDWHPGLQETAQAYV